MKSLVQRALAGERVERPPVWLMRQAGRYMAEYRAVKERHGFLGMCRTPEVAAEVSMQPMRLLDPDAAIIFADIMLPAETLGIEVDFAPGPVVRNPITQADDVRALQRRDVNATVGYVFEAIRQLRAQLDQTYGAAEKSLFGFAGAPWTMACYLIAQGPYKHFAGTQVFAAQQPKAMTALLDALCEVTIEYLQGQIAAGADVIQLFDSWGGVLGEADYRRYSLPFIQRITEGLQSTGCPVVLYLNGTAHLFAAALDSGAHCISIDWRTDLKTAHAQARRRSIAVQGNFDPTHLFLPEAELRREVDAMLQGLDSFEGYLVNLGHGILPATPPAHVQTFVDTVKQQPPKG